MLDESKTILKNDTNLILNKIDDLFIKTKTDVRKFKKFSKKWIQCFQRNFRREFLYYISVNKKQGKDFLNGNDKRLIIDYDKYKNFEFDVLLFLLNNFKFIDELKNVIDDLEEPGVFKVIVQDLLLLIIFDGENKNIPENLTKAFQVCDMDSNTIISNVSDYLGKSIKISSSNVVGPIEKIIENLFKSSDKAYFSNDFINFIKNIINLYKESKIKKEYFSVLNEYFSRLLSLVFTYNEVAIKHNKNNFKLIYKLIERIQHDINNDMIIDEKTLSKVAGYKDSCEYFFECGALIDEIVGISKIYNKELEKNKLEKNDTNKEKEYVDEESELRNKEKQMITAYVKENVLDKFSCISNAYNPTVRIDEEELYKNLPVSNKKEGFDIMMKILKSNNVNHEINDLIVRLYLYDKGLRKTLTKK